MCVCVCVYSVCFTGCVNEHIVILTLVQFEEPQTWRIIMASNSSENGNIDCNHPCISLGTKGYVLNVKINIVEVTEFIYIYTPF